MQQVLASNLPQKPVLSADGRKLGTVHNITMDLHTGELEHLIIEPDRSSRDFAEIEKTDEGYLQVSADRVTGLDDHVVVNLPERKKRPSP